MTSRRSTVSKARAHARDGGPLKAQGEPNIAPRLTALENAIKEIRQTLDTQVKRIAALQAHLDHVSSRLT
jgi:hypothetical protein